MKQLYLLIALILLTTTTFAATAYWLNTDLCSDGNPGTYDYFYSGTGCLHINIDANTYLGNVNGTNLRALGNGTTTTDNTYTKDGNITAKFTYTVSGRTLTVTNTSTGLIGVDKNAWRIVPPQTASDGFVSPYRPSGGFTYSSVDLNYSTDYNLCLIASNPTQKKYDENCLIINVGAEPPSNAITWNVYRTGTSINLTAVNVDCNQNEMDKTNQTSPFESPVYPNKSFTCNFTRTGYDANNGITGYSDTNKTITVYLTDSTAPSVGATTTSSFTINSSQIWGTGNIIGGTATDSGSGIDTSSCEYTIDNGSNWLAATWNTDHCEKTGITIVNGTTYTFNIRVKDLAGNQGTGTATTTYTGDNVAPTVGSIVLTGFNTYSNFISGSGTISIAVSDATSGINQTSCQYTINGTNWFYSDANSTHCFQNITTVNGTSYTFNFRVSDNAANQTVATPTSTYTGSTTPPTTNFTMTVPQDFNNWTTITLTCVPGGAACVNTQYRIDSGTWFNMDKNKNDYNSTEVQSTQAAYKTYQTYYFNKTRTDANGTATQYVTSITNQIKETSTATTKVKYHIVFMDGTDENTTENTTNTTYSAKTYVVTTQNKDVNYIETLMACDTGTTSCYFKDTNILYTENSPWIDYNGIGLHHIDYNSTDAIGNTETTKQADINMPILVTVKKPKNIVTNIAITEPWEIILTGPTYYDFNGLTNDQNIYLNVNTALPYSLRIQDQNHTAYSPSFYSLDFTPADANTYILQPYLLAAASSYTVKIVLIKQTNLTTTAYPGVTVKIYEGTGYGRIQISQVVTDSSGRGQTYLAVGQAYEFEFYDGTTQLTANGYQIAPVTVLYDPTGQATLTFTILSSSGTVTTPTGENGVTVSFYPLNPGVEYSTTGTFDNNQYIQNDSNGTYTATLHVYQNGIEILVPGVIPKYGPTTASNLIFSQSIPWTSLSNYPIVFNMHIVQQDGNEYDYNYTYNLWGIGGGIDENYQFDILGGLRTGVRTDLGCSQTGTCLPLLAIAIMIMVGTLGVISFKLGYLGGQGTVGLALIILSTFTYINWVPLELTAICFIAGAAFVINEVGRR